MSRAPAGEPGGRVLQPLLHDLVAVLAAPTQVWSADDGQIRAAGAQGGYHSDVRVLSEAVLTVCGEEPESIAVAPRSAGDVLFVGLARQLGDPGPDPTVRVERRRTVTPGVVEESVTVRSTAGAALTAEITVRLAVDLAGIEEVKSGRRSGARTPHRGPDGWTWSGGAVTVRLDPGAATVEEGPAGLLLRWSLPVGPGAAVGLRWAVLAEDTAAVVRPAGDMPPWQDVRVDADDRRLGPLAQRSFEDLAALRLSPTVGPGETFLAAGAPWFLALFGRDSLWAARMLLPFGTELAASTLRVLATRQGSSVDVDSAEEPGKVLHEVRRDTFTVAEGHRHTVVLPPVYYGTVDATPLWVCLLHDAWRWGMPDEQVAGLLPAAERALAWMVDYGDADGDGLLEYVDTSGHGLANQGWKDSGDSVQWRRGELATPPLALCEVQGYAHEAAVSGAALLDAFDRPGADRWREWAAGLAKRFRAAFWVGESRVPHPAIALDGDKRPVDSLTSNIGHLLGTGLLDADEEAAVVAALSGPTMDSGFGLRTMSTEMAGYAPLGYHLGTVWPHDTAIVVAGMVRAGHGTAAVPLVEGLLSAGAAFDGRLPELFAGDARAEVGRPVPYPAACRPQAWAAAGAASLATSLLGLRADIPSGRLRIAPTTPSPVGAVSVEGMRLAGRPLAVAVDAGGGVRRVDTSAPVTVVDATGVRLPTGDASAPPA